MVDVWRQKNLNNFRYTWRRRNPSVIQSRLDFFLVSFGLLGQVAEADIIPGFKSDHSAITLEITVQQQPRGPGFWKFNCSLLKDINYVNLVNNFFQNSVQNIQTEDPILKWEMIKLEIRSETISFGAKKKKDRKKKISDLESQLKQLEIDNFAVLSPEKRNRNERNKVRVRERNRIQYKGSNVKK